MLVDTSFIHSWKIDFIHIRKILMMLRNLYFCQFLLNCWGMRRLFSSFSICSSPCKIWTRLSKILSIITSLHWKYYPPAQWFLVLLQVLVIHYVLNLQRLYDYHCKNPCCPQTFHNKEFYHCTIYSSFYC